MLKNMARGRGLLFNKASMVRRGPQRRGHEWPKSLVTIGLIHHRPEGSAFPHSIRDAASCRLVTRPLSSQMFISQRRVGAIHMCHSWLVEQISGTHVARHCHGDRTSTAAGSTPVPKGGGGGLVFLACLKTTIASTKRSPDFFHMGQRGSNKIGNIQHRARF